MACILHFSNPLLQTELSDDHIQKIDGNLYSKLIKCGARHNRNVVSKLTIITALKSY
jgi:hypothetical protein